MKNMFALSKNGFHMINSLMTVFSLRCEKQNLDAAISSSETESEGSGIDRQVQRFLRNEQREHLEYVNILQTFLRGTMLCNLLKFKLPFLNFNKSVVVLLGIVTNFLGIFKSIKLIRKE